MVMKTSRMINLAAISPVTRLRSSGDLIKLQVRESGVSFNDLMAFLRLLETNGQGEKIIYDRERSYSASEQRIDVILASLLTNEIVVVLGRLYAKSGHQDVVIIRSMDDWAIFTSKYQVEIVARVFCGVLIQSLLKREDAR